MSWNIVSVTALDRGWIAQGFGRRGTEDEPWSLRYTEELGAQLEWGRHANGVPKGGVRLQARPATEPEFRALITRELDQQYGQN
jgi:hypothetical protein